MSDEASAREARRARSRKRRRKKKASAEDQAAEDQASEDTKRPRKKRRRKKREGERHRSATRPPFARDYPDHPALDTLVRAFQRGNFAEVRRGAPALVDGEVDDDVKRAARDLRRRIDPAPTSIYLWTLGVCLLVFLYGYYVSHAH